MGQNADSKGSDGSSAGSCLIGGVVLSGLLMFFVMVWREGWSIQNWPIPWYAWIVEIVVLGVIALFVVAIVVSLVIGGVVMLTRRLFGWPAEKSKPPASESEPPSQQL